MKTRKIKGNFSLQTCFNVSRMSIFKNVGTNIIYKPNSRGAEMAERSNFFLLGLKQQIFSFKLFKKSNCNFKYTLINARKI